MCKFIGKSKERILCKLNKIEILRLYSIVHVAMETTKTSHFTSQSKSFISIFSLAKFQYVSCNLSFDMIWQMTYTHKLPKQCSATLKQRRIQTPSDKGGPSHPDPEIRRGTVFKKVFSALRSSV